MFIILILHYFYEVETLHFKDYCTHAIIYFDIAQDKRSLERLRTPMPIFTNKPPRKIKKLLEDFMKLKRYRKVANIGSGGIADITSRFDSQLNRVVACKILQEKSFENEHLLKAFITETRLMSFLDHPGIVPIYDAFIDDGRPCYTMKLVDGMRLSSVLKYRELSSKHSKLSLNQQLDIFIKICETMAYAHSMGVIHLDIKPDNILIGKFGEVMVLDWGNARLYKSKPYDDFFRRHLGNAIDLDLEREIGSIILGTPDYMSPEQTNTSRDKLTPASDIFSTGIILYQMLTGKQPFSAFEETKEIMTHIRSFTPEAAHKINTDVPLKLSQICSRMLNKNKAKRYNTFNEILSEFTEFYNSGQAFETKIFKPGEILISEGEQGEYAFRILTGLVEVSKLVEGKKKVLTELGEGEVVGELAIFSKQPRNATITAIEETEIRIMGRNSVEEELQKLSPWVGSMIETLSERFIELNDKAAKLDG